MKATINGVIVEGTPEEIAKYKELQTVEVKTLFKLHSTINDNPKCPNEGKACYCTGACMGGNGTANYKGLMPHYEYLDSFK